MNALLKISLLSILISIINLHSLVAQTCNVHGIDGGTNTFFLAAGARLGQTFQACATGTIDRVDVNLITTGNYDFWLCTPTGGMIDDAMKSSFVVTTPGIQSINISPPVEVTVGETYEFQLSNNAANFGYIRHGGLSGTSLGDYTLGTRTDNGNATDADLDFDVLITSATITNPIFCPIPVVAPVAVPSMGEWAIVCLTLFMTIVGVVGLSRKPILA